MQDRKRGRALVIAGLIAILLSFVWWEAAYDATFRALGRNLKISHPMDCLLLFTGPCAQDKAAVLSGLWPAYNPLALWLSFAVLLAGLVVVYRSAPLGLIRSRPPASPSSSSALEPFIRRDLAAGAHCRWR